MSDQGFYSHHYSPWSWNPFQGQQQPVPLHDRHAQVRNGEENTATPPAHRIISQQHQYLNKDMSNPSSSQNQDPVLVKPSLNSEVAQSIGQGGLGGVQQRTGRPPILHGINSPQAYEMQIMLLEQQNKKRLLLARQEQDNTGDMHYEGLSVNQAPNDYQFQLMILEQQNKKRLMMARAAYEDRFQSEPSDRDSLINPNEIGQSFKRNSPQGRLMSNHSSPMWSSPTGSFLSRSGALSTPSSLTSTVSPEPALSTDAGVHIANGDFNFPGMFTPAENEMEFDLFPEDEKIGQVFQPSLAKQNNLLRDTMWSRETNSTIFGWIGFDEGKQYLSKGANTVIRQEPQEAVSYNVLKTKSCSPFASAALAVVILRRCINRRQMKQCKGLENSKSPASPSPIPRQDLLERKSFEKVDLHSWLMTSQTSIDSMENSSINSFEDDLTEDSDDMHSDPASPADNAIFWAPEAFVNALKPQLDRLPAELASTIRSEVSSLFETWLLTYLPIQNASHSGIPSSPESKDTPERLPNEIRDNGNKRKRSSEERRDGSPGENGDDGGQKRMRKFSSPPKSVVGRWACPYYQKDPHHYCMEGAFADYRKCSKSPGFAEVHRVKNHIYTYHTAIYCRRCYFQFKSKVELSAHERAQERCEVREPQPLEGIDDNQRDLLRPRDRNPSEEERWKNVYKICFPDDQVIPSPYYIHYTQEAAILRRDVLAVVDEETMSPENIDRDRLLQRLREIFDRNSYRSRSITFQPLTQLLPTPSSSDASGQTAAAPPNNVDLWQSSDMGGHHITGAQEGNFASEIFPVDTMGMSFDQFLSSGDFTPDPNSSF